MARKLQDVELYILMVVAREEHVDWHRLVGDCHKGAIQSLDGNGQNRRTRSTPSCRARPSSIIFMSEPEYHCSESLGALRQQGRSERLSRHLAWKRRSTRETSSKMSLSEEGRS